MQSNAKRSTNPQADWLSGFFINTKKLEKQGKIMINSGIEVLKNTIPKQKLLAQQT